MTPLSCSLCITKFNDRAPPVVAPTLPPTVQIHFTCTYHAKPRHPGPSENGGVSLRCPAVCVAPLAAHHCRVLPPYTHPGYATVTLPPPRLSAGKVPGGGGPPDLTTWLIPCSVALHSSIPLGCFPNKQTVPASQLPCCRPRMTARVDVSFLLPCTRPSPD